MVSLIGNAIVWTLVLNHGAYFSSVDPPSLFGIRIGYGFSINLAFLELAGIPFFGILLVVSSIYGLIRRLRRAVPDGLCRTCGYDLPPRPTDVPSVAPSRMVTLPQARRAAFAPRRLGVYAARNNRFRSVLHAAWMRVDGFGGGDWALGGCSHQANSPAMNDETGFVPMFNGKDTSGWEYGTNKHGMAGKGYAVDGDVVSCTKADGGVLYTDRDYSDFVLRFAFKLTPHANNGIGIRVPYDTGNPSYEGMELQVLDDTDPAYAHLRAASITGRSMMWCRRFAGMRSRWGSGTRSRSRRRDRMSR